jgi:hypothetical protein
MAENQTQPNTPSNANSSGEPKVRDAEAGARDSASPGGESRSFESRPGDSDAAHDSQEGDSVRSAHRGTIGGDMGRDESKAPPSGLDPNAPGGEMEHQDPRHMNDLAEAQGEDGGSDAADRSFQPSHVEANLAREQGNGVGQRELDGQRDATGADSTEHFGQMGPADGGDSRSDVEHLDGASKGGVEQA